MPVRDESALRPETRVLVSDYLTTVESRLRQADPATAAEITDALRTHLLEQLDAGSAREDASAVIAEIGEIDEASTGVGSGPASTDADGTSAEPQGRFLGMPYDFRPPTTERVASRWWAPEDPRVFTPKVWGAGWAINFGALAVKLRLIEPDAEDVPFASVPDRAFLAALTVPVAMTAAVLGSYLVTRGALPELVATHWDWRGVADGFAPAAQAFAMPMLMAALPTCVAVWSLASRKPALNRAASIGFATLFACLAVAVWALSLLHALGVTVAGWVVLPAILCAAWVPPLIVLTLLARSGRAAEIRRDLVR